MTKNQAWLKAIRLRTLPLSLAGILLGSAIAYQEGYGNELLLILALITTILFQILSNLANDLGDGMKGTDNEDRIGPMRAIQSGLISQQEMKRAVIGLSVLSGIAAFLLIYFGARTMPSTVIFTYIILAILCIVAAISYTVGKKAYGYNGLGDVMVFIFFGLVSVLGVYSLYSHTFNWINLLPAVTIGLLSTAVLNLNNMRDFVSDRKANKRTFVVIIGINAAKMYHVLLIIIALLSFLLFVDHNGNTMFYLSGVPFVVLLIHVRKVMQTKDPKAFDPELKKVALSTFAIALLYFIITLVQ